MENFFHHIILHQNIKFTMGEENNGELAFRDTLLKRNNGKMAVLVYRSKIRRILTNTYRYQSSHDQAN